MTLKKFWQGLDKPKRQDALKWTGCNTFKELAQKIKDCRGLYLTSCVACDLAFIENDQGQGFDEYGTAGYLDGNWSEKANGWVHDECADDPHSNFSIARYDQEGLAYIVQIGEYGDYCQKCTDNDCEHIKEASGVVAGRKLRRMDAWRAWDEPVIAKGMIVLADGWVTGYPDDTIGHKNLTYELQENIKEGVSVPVYWVFYPTSNLFSTGSQLVIAKGHKQQFAAWLKNRLGARLDALQEAFS